MRNFLTAPLQKMADKLLLDENDEDLTQKILHESIDHLENRIHGIVKDFPEAILNSQDVLAVEDATQMLQYKLDSLIEPMLDTLKGSEEKVSKLENSNVELQAKLRIAEEKRNSDRLEIELLRNQILDQTMYIANIGAVLVNLVWRFSNDPQMISTWLSCRNQVEEFLTIADKTLASFIKTYGSVLPPEKSGEYQFTMGLLGAVSNISSSPEGRQFLIDDTNGKSLIRNIVVSLPDVPTNLKRLMLVILFNMSVNKSGLEYLLDLPIGYAIGHCLEENNSEALQLLGLRLLRSMTHDPVVEFRQRLDDLFGSVSIERISKIADDEKRGRNASIARNLLDHIFEKIRKPSLHG